MENRDRLHGTCNFFARHDQFLSAQDVQIMAAWSAYAERCGNDPHLRGGCIGEEIKGRNGGRRIDPMVRSPTDGISESCRHGGSQRGHAPSTGKMRSHGWAVGVLTKRLAISCTTDGLQPFAAQSASDSLKRGARQSAKEGEQRDIYGVTQKLRRAQCLTNLRHNRGTQIAHSRQTRTDGHGTRLRQDSAARLSMRRHDYFQNG